MSESGMNAIASFEALRRKAPQDEAYFDAFP
jgi:hypothetical protein